MTKQTKVWVAIMVFVFIFGYCLVGAVFAGGVTDDNNGNKGDIFVSTGENHGANSVGTWTDSSFLKGEKGDKGDKGDQGIAGVNGEDGEDGKDVDPSVVENFKNNINGNSAKLDNLDNRVNKLEETQYYVQGSIRVKDTKKWEVQAPVVSYSFTRNKFDRVGVEFMYKWGESYEEKLINEQNTRLEKLEALLLMEETANLDYANEHYNIVQEGTVTRITEK